MSELKEIPRKDTRDYDHKLPRTIDAPARHYNVLHAMAAKFGDEWKQGPNHEQGFLTSDGYFMRRRSACIIAERAGQIKLKTGPSATLFSEDLW